MPLDQVDADKLLNGEPTEEKEMSFLEHLEELRWHIIRSLIAIVVLGVALFIGQEWLFEKVIFGPTHPDFFSYKVICNLSNLVGLGDTMCFTPPEFEKQAIGFGAAFIISIKDSFVMGFILSFPYIFYEFCRFVKIKL